MLVSPPEERGLRAPLLASLSGSPAAAQTSAGMSTGQPRRSAPGTAAPGGRGRPGPKAGTAVVCSGRAREQQGSVGLNNPVFCLGTAVRW